MTIRSASHGNAITELGEEKQCVSCGEFWPVDAEFFEVKKSGKGGWSPRCHACIKERVWRLQWRRHWEKGHDVSAPKYLSSLRAGRDGLKP